GAQAHAPGDRGQRSQHAPAVVGEAPETVAVRHAGVAELVGRPPVPLQRGDVRAPRLHTEPDHAASIAERSTAVNRRAVEPLTPSAASAYRRGVRAPRSRPDVALAE